MHFKLRKWVKITLFLIILLLSIFSYSRYIEPKRFKVKEYSIVNSKIPDSFYGYKIVHISDIHYLNTITKKELVKIVNEINLLKPDIILFTGDLFDKNIKYSKNDIKDIIDTFNTINKDIKKYIINGDEDKNLENFNKVINNSNFININDKYELIYNKGYEPILLMGISSNYKDNHIKKTIDKLNKEIKEKYKYSILILHEPDFIDEIDYSKFNLILSGHSLGGVIKLPFISNVIKNKYSQNYYDSYYNLNNTLLYISNGIGTNNYKIRLLNMPSINFYRLRNK